MSEALNITRIEHNPERKTLAINYSISEPGLWRLFPSYCGYRDVTQDYWTLVVPDSDDPSHTDFPIRVAPNTVFYGVFIWNYATSRGIGPENFDSNKSYYIQLTIFNPSEGEVIPPSDVPGTTSDPIIITEVQVPGSPRPRPPEDPPIIPPRSYNLPVLPKPRPPDLPGGGGGGDRPRIPTTLPVTPGGNGGIGPIIPEEPQPNTPKPRPEDPLPPVTTGPRSPVVLGPKPRPPEPPRGPFTPDRALIPRPQPGGIGPAIPGDDQGIPVDPYPGGIGPGDVGLGNPMDPYPGGEGPQVPGDVSAGDYEPNVVATDPYRGTILLPGGIPVVLPPGDYNSPYPGDPSFEVEDPDLTNRGDVIIFSKPLTPEIPDEGQTDPVDINVDPRPLVTNDTSLVDSGATSEEPEPNTNTFQSTRGRTEATTIDRGIEPNGVTREGTIDRTALQSTNGIDEGYLTKYDYKEKAKNRIARRYTIGRIDASHLMSSATIGLEVPIDDVPKGESIFTSASLNVPAGVSVDSTLELWIIDSQGRSILLDYSDLSLVTSSSPSTLSYSIASYNFAPGPMTITCIARDKDGKVIAVNSRKVIIRSTLAKLGTDSNLKIRESRNLTTASALPAAIVDQASLGKAPISFYIRNGKPVKIIINKIQRTENKFSAVLIDSGASAVTKYRIDLFSISETEPTPGGIPVIELNQKYADKKVIKNLRLTTSTDRVKIDGEEAYPYSHVAGITNFVTADQQLLLCLAPDSMTDAEGNRKFDLYLGSSYDIKGFTLQIIKVDNARHTIRGSCPYVMEKLGLVIHGKDPNSIPENYAIQYANTDELGNFNWPGVSIQAGDYYSIIVARYDQFNAYNGIVYSSRI